MKGVAVALGVVLLATEAEGARPSRFGLTGDWIVYQSDAFEGASRYGPPVAAALPNDPDIIDTRLNVTDDVITIVGKSLQHDIDETCTSPNVTVRKLHRNITNSIPGTNQKFDHSLFEGVKYISSLSIECKEGHFGPYRNETIYPIAHDRFIIIWWDNLILKFHRTE